MVPTVQQRNKMFIEESKKKIRTEREVDAGEGESLTVIVGSGVNEMGYLRERTFE